MNNHSREEIVVYEYATGPAPADADRDQRAQAPMTEWSELRPGDLGKDVDDDIWEVKSVDTDDTTGRRIYIADRTDGSAFGHDFGLADLKLHLTREQVAEHGKPATRALLDMIEFESFRGDYRVNEHEIDGDSLDVLITDLRTGKKWAFLLTVSRVIEAD